MGFDSPGARRQQRRAVAERSGKLVALTTTTSTSLQTLKSPRATEPATAAAITETRVASSST